MYNRSLTNALTIFWRQHHCIVSWSRDPYKHHCKQKPESNQLQHLTAKISNKTRCRRRSKEKKRAERSTTSLHFLLRCAPTASKSVPTDTGESPNARNSENSQSFKNTLQLNASQFWCSSEHLKAESGSSNDILKWLVPLSGLLMLIETTRDCEIANATQTWETLNFARRAPRKRKMEESASHH